MGKILTQKNSISYRLFKCQTIIQTLRLSTRRIKFWAFLRRIFQVLFEQGLFFSETPKNNSLMMNILKAILKLFFLQIEFKLPLQAILLQTILLQAVTLLSLQTILLKQIMLQVFKGAYLHQQAFLLRKEVYLQQIILHL